MFSHQKDKLQKNKWQKIKYKKTVFYKLYFKIENIQIIIGRVLTRKLPKTSSFPKKLDILCDTIS